MSNRLAREKSPYLLQHAENPVDWYPWGGEAFKKAESENKPIFLSIGYSTCHWCHVMEEESFVNPQIAQILNEHFVSVKVDREERPDVDQVYMQAVMAISGAGGWPMSVFLTPELKPFYGGTYFPPEDRWGRPGFANLLQMIAGRWQQHASRGELTQAAEELTQALRKEGAQPSIGGQEPPSSTLDEHVLAKAYQQFSAQYDAARGGFGSAPKFPRSHALSWLLRYWKRYKNPAALGMVEHTLTAMAHGGMYDQLGGGFHRYSVDDRWHVPHFEKMLYDQAMLARTYVEAYQITHHELYARIAREIFEYVLRDMTSQEGAFYSAEDADSLPSEVEGHKSEGAFYIWSEEEIRRALGEKNAEIFDYYFGVEKNGNAAEDPHGEFTGKNILCVAHTQEETAGRFKISVEEARDILNQSRQKLFELRTLRPRPHRDGKVLADWNGLMISAFAFGAQVLDEPRYAEAAQKAADFIFSKMREPSGRLLHRFCAGEAAIPGFVCDYAACILGLTELYETNFLSRNLEEAGRLAREMMRLFWDEKHGGVFLAGRDAENLIAPSKELYDGAIPSGNSLAAHAWVRAGRLTEDPELEGHARDAFRAFAAQIAAFPSGYPEMLIAFDFALGPSREIKIEGDETSAETKEALHIIRSKFLPETVVMFKPVRANHKISVCRNHVCRLPLVDMTQLREELGK
ncbi:MAG: thioredoxin domain-containing protein [Candidatus Omnitrophica bacterium]|nr:thioredoxin domain-containing protein [Candidatus Omnitrophota bacterium]